MAEAQIQPDADDDDGQRYQIHPHSPMNMIISGMARAAKLRTAAQRLAAYLLNLEAAREGAEFELPRDKGAITAQLGMTRESLSRAFAALEADAITVRGARISVRGRQRLIGHCPFDPLIDECA